MDDIMKSETIANQYYDSYEVEAKAAAKPKHYIDLYNKYFDTLTDKELAILELGIFEGHSLEYFSRIFPNARLFGVDINKCERVYSSDRVTMYQGSQNDKALYQRIMAENDIKTFDIIIDDCSHIGTLTLESFNILYPFLSLGGLYVIEDWGTGYWEKWPGGKKFNKGNHLKPKGRSPEYVRSKFFGVRFESHQHGIPGIIKQLVDEVAMRDIARGLDINASPKIEYLHVYPGIVFMKKTES